MKQEVNPKVDSVDLNKLKYGTSVDIKQYNSSSKKYTVPSFGVIFVRVPGGSKANISGLISADIWCSGELINSIMVPAMKGSQLYVGGAPEIAYFIPITMG